ncbi:MAG: hypothetical protein IIT78_02700 [Mycoplasmataceae bacterium]|nr:hypothetical protein [Mycoplasmataceae bacterium]
MRNKKLKIALQSACIIALFCIVPTCVISCSNSQSSSNSNSSNNQNNNNSSTNFVNATVSSTNNDVSKSNYQSYLESISDNILSSAQTSASNYFDSWVNVYAISNNSMSPSSYTISLNNFYNGSYTYSWYVISQTQWDNILRSNIQSVETSSTFSQHQTEQNIIQECIENNSVLSNKESYTFDMDIPSTGEYFVCVIKNSQNTWYSKPVLLYSNNSNTQPTPINNLNISSYSLKLASKNSTVNSNGSVQINANQGEKITFNLELQNQNKQNLTSSDFNKIKYYKQGNAKGTKK